MKMTKRILSSVMVLLMVLSVVSTGFTAFAVESNEAFLEEIVLEPIARPDVTFTVTPVTRVALAANSLEPGTAIVKATPSGVPELSGSYAAQAYAGETPIATKIEFQSNTIGVTPKGISCSNDSVVLSDLNYNGSTGTYSCEIVSGTAEAGSAITFTIDYEWTDGNSYQEKCVTFVEKIANGGSYVEAQSEIQALAGTGSYYRLWASASTRLLGTSVYYEQPANIETSASDPYKAYGVYNVATGSKIENTASGYNTLLFADDKTDKPAGKHNQANEFTVPGTTIAHVYVDASAATTLQDINLRLDANVGQLSDRNNDNPYTALADAWVSAGANTDTIVTTNDATAQAAIGLAIPAKADHGVTQFEQNASMTTLTGGVGQYGHLFTSPLTGTVANLVDGSSYTITTKYYSYMWVKKGLLQHYNMTSSATVPTAMTFHIVDKGALRDLIDYVMNSDPTTPSTRTQLKGANPQGWFYRSGFSQFQTAYTEALRVYNNPKATQSEIDAATKSLQTMYNNLQLKTADYTRVNALYDQADEILDNEEAYSAADIALIREAQEMVTKSYSILYQGAVDQMAENLDRAIKNATPLAANYEAVYAAKAEAEKLDKNVYTADSWKAVEDAINAVDYTLNALHQDEVDAMAQAITDAIANLQVVTANFDALNAKLAEAKAIDRSLYINGSLLIDPIDNAEKAVAENAVTPWAKERQNEVDALTKALDDTIKSLILRSAYKDDLKAAIDAEIPGVIEYYDQTILAEYDALVAEGIELYNDDSLTVYDQSRIDAKTEAIEAKYAELMASYDDSCRHPFVEDAVIENEVAADCVNDGSYDTVVYCSDCGAEVSRETIVVPALGHTEGEAVVENEVAATPTTDGSYDTVVYCTVCGAEVSRETTVVPALGHTPAEAVEENRVEATCTEAGSYDMVVYCTCCEEKVELSRETIVIDALGHTDGEAVIENEVAADCVNNGSYDTVVYCTVCGEEVSRKTTVVPALGHEEAEAVEENRKEADCVTAGSYDMVVYCTVCGEELSRESFEIEALGHTPAEAVEENRVEATYEAAGSYDSVVYCTVCGEELSRETIEIPMLDGYFKAEEGTTTVIDTELGYIYGLDIGLADLEGYVDYSSSVSYETPDGIGTGMTLTTYRGGVEWETYTIIIFGDLNGDGVIDIYDASILAAIVNGDMELEEGDAILFAADLNGDTAVDIYDLAILNAVVNGETEITQVPLA
ncbi:MAG: hypothetical protein E7536_07380 [Ruminococcaceae bacterium]|nr:hypothetical protein [Oscillospiraceae bacterium]